MNNKLLIVLLLLVVALGTMSAVSAATGTHPAGMAPPANAAGEAACKSCHAASNAKLSEGSGLVTCASCHADPFPAVTPISTVTALPTVTPISTVTALPTVTAIPTVTVTAIPTVTVKATPTVTLTATPTISFIDPTPANNSTITQKYVFINTSINNSNETTAFIEWNNSLMAWLRFNNENGENSTSFRDWSNWGNNGSCSGNNCPVITSGKFGSALNFDGSDDYSDVPNSTSLNPSTITLEAWFNANSGGLASQKPLIQKPYTNHVAPYYQYMLSLADTATCPKSADFYLSINGTFKYVEVNNLSYNYGQWHYLAGTYNGSTMTMYLDGVEVGTTQIVGTITPYDTILEFGAYPNLPKYSYYVFNGSVDEVRIHSRALSPDEIKASYNAGIYNLYSNFTNLPNAIYDYRAYVQKPSGMVNQTEIRTVNVSGASTQTETVNVSGASTQTETVNVSLGGTEK